MGMICTKHNFSGKYQCEHCELDILDKIDKKEFDSIDPEVSKQVLFWINKRISDTLLGADLL